MGLNHSTKVFGCRQARLTKLLTDNSGAPATYVGTTSAVVASPAPTTTTFSVTGGTGATLTTTLTKGGGTVVGRAISVGAQIGIVASITTDAIVLSNTLATAPTAPDVVFAYESYPLIGLKTLTLNTTVKSVDLRGDNTFLDTDTVFEGLEFEADNAKLNLDVVSILMGGSIADTGSTPLQQSTWTMPAIPTFNYTRLEARCFAMDQPAGDLHIICNKAKASDSPLVGFADEDYAYPKIKFKAVPPNGTTAWLQYVYNETAVAVF